MLSISVLLVVGILTLAVGSFIGSGEEIEAQGGNRLMPTEAERRQAQERVLYDENGEPEGLHRHRRWSDQIGQGAQPVGEIAFKNLAALGYKTILTVDGALPEVELAKRYGLRYVHLPIGYDAVPHDVALQIAKTVKITEGPIYVHCHHGKHRGPAAAQIARMCADGISNEDGVQGLVLSGTSENYEGLWRDVRNFEVPSAEAVAKVSADLPSRVVPQGMRAMMVDLSHRFEYLKASKLLGWKKLPDHPDINPPHEARMLWELCREIDRLEEIEAHGAAFKRFNRDSEKAGVALEKALRADNHAAADRAYGTLKNLCSQCHKAFRN